MPLFFMKSKSEKKTRQRVRDFIEKENASHRVVVWSKSGCPYCAAAKNLFHAISGPAKKSNGWIVHDIDREAANTGMVQEILEEMTGQRTVPNVFVNNQHIGGYQQTKACLESGKLHQLLGLSGQNKMAESTAESSSWTTEAVDASKGSDDGMEVKRSIFRTLIEKENASHDVVIWSWSRCPYCEDMEDLFRDIEHSGSGSGKKLDWVVHELDQMATGGKLREELFRITGQRSLPNVFVRNEHIGGSSDTHQAFRSGKLAKLLPEYIHD